jgi:hypothetical protein
MDSKDEKMFFAAMAMIGLVMRGESPSDTAQQAWLYASFMMQHTEPKERNDEY